MNLDIQFRNQLQGVSQWIVEELDRLYATVATSWNQEHADDGTHGAVHARTLAVSDQPRVSAYHNTTQSHGSSGSYVTVNLNAEDFDVGDMHNTATNTSRVTIPAGEGGLYILVGKVRFISNATGERAIRFTKNGTEVENDCLRVGANPSDDTVLTATLTAILAAGDYIELQALQTSGGALTLGNVTRTSANVLQVVKLW